jgi:pyrroline-5-carboxylate reductase
MTISHDNTIAFVGAGNMAHSLINGLIAHEYPVKHIVASDPTQEKCDFIHQEFGVQCYTNNLNAIEHAQIIILAVKPHHLKTVLAEIKSVVQSKKPLIISIAAGVSLQNIAKWLALPEKSDIGIVRCMPNVAAFVQSGATGMYANSHVKSLQRDLAENIMRAVGLTIWVDNENLIDVVTAVSGAGPAYFFLIMEAMEKTAQEMGLSLEDARTLIAQTALGAARFVLSTDESIANLRERVTSKGGTTEKALAVLENYKIREAFDEALKAGYARSVEIAKAEG